MMAMRRAAVLLLSLAPLTLSAQRPLKVYISADMEGIAGVVSGEQLGTAGFEYQRFREFMTAEVLAAIAGAREAGATEILVSDSHGNGQNLLIERLPADVRVIRSWPRPLMMMQGIDSTFAAAVFIGYHSGTANLRGVRAHTFSSANLTSVKIDGVEVPEGGVNAAIAGHFGVPIVAISGDDAAVAEVRALVGDLAGAVVKEAISFHSAKTMTPEASQALIRQTVRDGVTRRASVRAYRVRAPLRLDVTFKHYTPAEILAYLPGIERTTSHSIRFTGRDILEVSRFIEFMNSYQPGLTP